MRQIFNIILDTNNFLTGVAESMYDCFSLRRKDILSFVIIMDVEVAITLVDSLVFQETDQHLSSLQISVLRGVWFNLSYEELTETCYCSVPHLKTVGSRLWALLSQILGEKVNKRTVRTILESYHQDRKTGKLRGKRINTQENRLRKPSNTIKINKFVEKADSWFNSDLLLQLTDRLEYFLHNTLTCSDADLSQFKSFSETMRLIHSLSSENYSLNRIPFDMISICRNVINDFNVDFPNRTIILSMFEETVLPDYDLTLITLIDENLVKNIIKHLLSNALKYSTSENIVTLDVNVEEQQGILTVVDQGIGIHPEELEQVFQPFYRATNARQYSGDGLGLSIVEKSVRLHQGELSVVSDMEYGSVFTVMLPIV